VVSVTGENNLLAPIYGWFSKGFDITDPREPGTSAMT
jgi:hypothetical protein